MSKSKDTSTPNDTPKNQKTSKTKNAPGSPRIEKQGGGGIQTPLEAGSAAGTGADSEKKPVVENTTGDKYAGLRRKAKEVAEKIERKKNQLYEAYVQEVWTGENERERKKEQLEREIVQALKDIDRKLPDKPTDNDKGSGLPAGAGDFTFPPGQAVFRGQELKLPTGFTIEVLKKLVDNLDKPVAYGILDNDNSPKSEASVQLRVAISRIKKALQKKKSPYRIITKRGESYLLRNSKQR